ncbi:hypothetical protein B4U79_18901 [Dinothrombium tinctorium]|uniref:DRBM domain-containing protein n=1 Tax=Dinothrombium tinctorium TaxID=1965070 RepID=A0A3S4Q3Y7_9ACAR|nr:hypothetical protein B4U79_18901 [Dinothrombium tinctorium]
MAYTRFAQLVLHPVTRLVQLQQVHKEREPQFRVIAEHTVDKRKKEFVIECSVSNQKSFANSAGKVAVAPIVSATGVRGSKKIAKKKAAEAVLQLLGHDRHKVKNLNSYSILNNLLNQINQH